MNTAQHTDVGLRDIVRVFQRRKRAIYATTLIVFSVAVLVCLVMTRRYQATGLIQMQKSSADMMDLGEMMGAASGGSTDSLSVNTDLQTRADILQSETLALHVVKELNLEKNEDFKAHFSPVSWALGLFSSRGTPDPKGAALEDSPHRRAHVLRVFSKQLSVKIIAGTRLIEIDYENRDPKVAAAVVNHLVQALIDYSFQTKFNATNQVSAWLEGQLGDLRKQAEGLQTKVVTLQQDSGIFGAGGTDLQGRPVVYSPVLDRLEQSTATLSQAHLNRILKGSIYEVVKTGNPEAISQLSGTSIGSAGGQGVANSLAVIQNLRGQEATLQAQIQQDSVTFGSAYPKLLQERASLKSLQASLHDEVERIRDRAKNDYDIAVQAEAGAQHTYDSDQLAAQKLNNKTIEYAILQKEADQSQELYQDLLKRLKEAGILEGLRSSDITVVDPGRSPDKPHRPNVPMYLTLGLALGLFAGTCNALLIEAIDNKLRSSEEVEAMGISLLGIIPHAKLDRVVRQAVLMDSGDFAFAEAIRSLRSSLLIARSGTPPRVILVTSGSPAEGKSTISLNLSIAMAQLGKKVLLLEADMRRPTLAKRMGLSNTNGLSELLANADAVLQPVQLADRQNFYFIPAGVTPPYPAELMGSARMKSLIEELKKQFDIVIIDSPPVLLVSDAQLLESLVDATVLVAHVDKTTRVALQRSYRTLLAHAKNPSMPAMGVVLNFVSTNSSAYYSYYGYYGGKKYEYGESEGGVDNA